MKILDITVFHSLKRVFTVHDLRHLKKIGIDYVTLSSLDVAYGEPQRKSNREILKIAKEMKLIPLMAFNLKEKEANDYLKSVLKDFKAIRVYPGHNQFSLTGEEFRSALAFVEGKEIPVIIQFRVKWGDNVTTKVEEVCKLAKEFEEINFIMSGVNYPDNLDIVRFARKLDNVFIDISYYQGLSGVEFLIKEVGTRRIVLGTAYPILYPESSLLKVLYANISDSEKEDILFNNAAKLLGLT